MSYYDAQEAINAMIGRTLFSVTLDKSRDVITFEFQDGHEQAFGVDGDCCSHSWIEHLERPVRLTGATLTGHESGGYVDATDDDDLNPEREHECLKVYRDIFHTDRGDIVLEYRNSSNGYYGGYLVVPS